MKQILLSTIAGLALGSACHAATFERLDGYGDTIYINGTIESGDEVRFAAALTDAMLAGTPIKSLRLNSPGGDHVAGTLIARMTRINALTTIVGNYDSCASMCALIFAAGTFRAHFSTGGIGVHSLGTYVLNRSNGERSAAFEDESAKADSTDMAREFKRYGTPDSIIGKVVTTPHDSITWLKTKELLTDDFSHLLDGNDAAPELSYAPPSRAVPPPPVYVPDRNDWSMTCQSQNGTYYNVTLFTNGTIAVRNKTYRVDDGHWAKNGAGSYLAKGKTKYGNYVAVFHSTNPQPYIVFTDRKGARVKDWCR